MPLAVMRATWTGFQGAPGVSTFYADPSAANPPVDDIRAFFQALVARLPSVVTITVDGEGDVISETTGQLSGSWSVAVPPSAVQGTATGSYAAPVGAVVNWRTDTIIERRRLAGKTFLVPLTDGAFEDDGTITAIALAEIRDAATGLVGATNPLHVWHRPSTPTSADGSSSPVTGSSVPDLAAVLRSRRD